VRTFSSPRAAHRRRSGPDALRFGLVGNVVNLNKFRKRKAKVERAKQAETNRRLHGRTKLERQRDALQKSELARGLEGKKLTRVPAHTEDDT
jgi:hypothetical protein